MVPPRGARCFGFADHEADIAALKEREVAGIEQEPHSQGVLVEVLGARQIRHGDGDLPNLFEVNHGLRGMGLVHDRASLLCAHFPVYHAARHLRSDFGLRYPRPTLPQGARGAQWKHEFRGLGCSPR